MSNSTRFPYKLLNSPESTRLFTSSARRNPFPSRRHTTFTGIKSIRSTYSFSPLTSRLCISRFTTKMETDREPSPQSSDIHVPDDFVHVQNLNSSDMKTYDEELLNSSAMKTEEEETERDNSNAEELQNSKPNLHEFVETVATRDAFATDEVSAQFENEGVDASSFADAVAAPVEVDENKVLAEELLKSLVKLECESSAEGGSCDVYLVGTAHVSQESCREVQAIISYLKPQVVFLELCSSRVAILSPQNLEVPTMKDMLHTWKKRNTNVFGVLYSWFLAKVASQLEVFPGSEFRVAFEEATKYGGKVILGDRPVQITLRRTWGKMKLWHKVKFLYSILFQAIFLPSPADLHKMLKEMNDVDMLTLVIQEMSKAFPTLMETLLYERDLYMSHTLLKVAREHTSVVAVVGKGHLQGIKKNWKQPVEVKELMMLPAKKSGFSAARILTSLGVAVAGVAIVTGIYYGGKR